MSTPSMTLLLVIHPLPTKITPSLPYPKTQVSSGSLLPQALITYAHKASHTCACLGNLHVQKACDIISPAHSQETPPIMPSPCVPSSQPLQQKEEPTTPGKKQLSGASWGCVPTCSWYSMPMLSVLTRIAIMIPRPKYLLSTIFRNVSQISLQKASTELGSASGPRLRRRCLCRCRRLWGSRRSLC